MARCQSLARAQTQPRALSKTRFSPVTWILLGLVSGGVLAAVIWALFMANHKPRKPALW